MTEETGTSAGNDPLDDWGEVGEETSGLLESRPAFWRDRWFYRVVGGSLAVIAGIALIGAIALAACDKPVPDSVVALGSTAIGALAGVLVADRR